MLRRYSIGAEQWAREIHVPQTIEGAFARGAKDAGRLHEALDTYGIVNSFEVYPGTHTGKVADRFQNHVMPFFSRSLCFQPGCR